MTSILSFCPASVVFLFTRDFFYLVLGNIYKACYTNVCLMSKQRIYIVCVWVESPQMA